MLNVNNTQTQNSVGIVGQTSSLIAQLLEIYSKLSVVHSALQLVDTKAERATGKSQASSIKDAAEHKARATRWQAGAGMVAGTIEVVGGAGSMTKTYFDNKSLEGELTNIGKYKDEVDVSLKGARDDVLSTMKNEDELKDALDVKSDMRKLSRRDDFKGLDSESDQFKKDSETISKAQTGDLETLDKHLDDLSVEKKKQMMSNNNHDLVSLYARAFGGIANGVGGMFAANQTTKAGLAEADSSLDQTSVSMLQSGVQQASKTADKYAEMASQIIQTLVQLAQVDVFN
ncbi:hypothetical protein [Simkania sp.]|uniref:hypothetical protein n=1 Tax=Simkania sp. TaxID=34094 RepID=UPI003B529351